MLSIPSNPAHKNGLKNPIEKILLNVKAHDVDFILFVLQICFSRISSNSSEMSYSFPLKYCNDFLKILILGAGHVQMMISKIPGIINCT